MTEEEYNKIIDEINKEDRKYTDKIRKAEKKKAYAILFLLISTIVLFGTIIAGERVPIAMGIIILIGDIISLSAFHMT